jgi:phosphatidylglycerol:prolipoprotein diacylglycerol transferase
MHPILFRIPLPKMTIQWGWVVLAAMAVAAVIAVVQFARERKPTQAVLIPAGIAAALLVARFALSSKLQGTFEVDAIPIYSYGVMLGLSLVVGWYLTLGLAERDGLPKEIMANCYVVTAVAAVVGSRVLYILTNLSEFETIGSMFAMRRGGLVAYGGFLGGFLGSLFYLRRYKIPLLPWADVAVPSLASGLMITRIGCYLFGCDFGKPLKETAPALLKKLGTFPRWTDGTIEHGSGSPAWQQHLKQQLIPPTAEASLPVHPTQLYEMLVGALLLAFLLTMRRYQTFRGQIFLLFTFAYGVCRFGLEIFRDDLERGSIPPAMQEHLLLALALTVLSIGYVIGISQMIDNPKIRRVTQVLAFAPPLIVYLVKKPETFAQAETYQLSTSQFVGVATGFAACVAFNVFYKAALAHPESAMNLGLPPDLGVRPGAAGAALDDDEDVEEERPAARRRNLRDEASTVAVTRTGKKKKKKKRAAVEAASDQAEPAARTAVDDEPRDDDEPARDEDSDGDGPAADAPAEPKNETTNEKKKKKAAGARDEPDD